MENFRTICEGCRAKGGYREHIAGDVGCFRYPHMEDLAGYVTYDSRHQYWISEKVSVDILKEIASRDITLYEFLVPEAKSLHIMDMCGVSYGDDMRQKAYKAVFEAYRRRRDYGGFPELTDQVVCMKDLPVRKGYEAVAALYEDCAEIPVHMVKVGCGERENPFPFGSMMKGTDLVFTDGNPWNFGQDFLHALYHLKEGIPGVSCDNNRVKELWAEVPELYALQLAEGRMARRVRLAPSPHPIHFTDYIYLRAFLGQAFVDEKEEAGFHPVYRFIEPSIRLMIYALRESGVAENPAEQHRILADAVLADQTGELTTAFDCLFGEGSFRQIYDTYLIYDKYPRALRIMKKSLLEEILFGGDDLLPVIGQEQDLERIWKDEAYREQVVREMVSH